MSTLADMNLHRQLKAGSHLQALQAVTVAGSYPSGPLDHKPITAKTICRRAARPPGAGPLRVIYLPSPGTILNQRNFKSPT